MTTTRKELLQTTGGAPAGLAFVGCELTAAAPAQAQARRREVVVSGKRVKTVDVHAHCAVPEALALMNLKLGGPELRPDLDMATEVSGRLRTMDEQGIDVQALSINPIWYKADRDLARQIIKIQNEKLAEACAANPERFVAFATVALQHPDLAAEQLEDGVKKYGLRGAGIGGSVNGEEISDSRFHPFWAKAEQLGMVVFSHPQRTGAPTDLQHRLQGNGYLENVIGNPLETTIALSHLIFEGTPDKFPGLKICTAHGGGFLPSYAGRSDHDWRESAPGGHGLSVSVDDDGHRSDPRHPGGERCRRGGDAGRDGDEAARDQGVAVLASWRRGNGRGSLRAIGIWSIPFCHVLLGRVDERDYIIQA